jgi:hypothetical protein
MRPALLLLVLASACHGDGADDFAERSATVKARTLPAGATLGRVISERRRNGAASSWSFETTMTWAEYARWVRSVLAVDYTSVRSDDATLDFTQQALGDEYDLQLIRQPGGPPLRIQATFTGMPD